MKNWTKNLTSIKILVGILQSINSTMKTKKTFFTLIICIFLFESSFAQTAWPILKHYDENHISKIAMPIGGIGTGTVSINGRGSLVDWEIMNVPRKGFSTGYARERCAVFCHLYQR